MTTEMPWSNSKRGKGNCGCLKEISKSWRRYHRYVHNRHARSGFIASTVCIQNDHNGDRQDFLVVWCCSHCACSCDAFQPSREFQMLRHSALAAVFQFKIPRHYIVRNSLKPATASRLLKPSNQMRWTLNNSQTVWRVSSMSELSFLCTQPLLYKGIVHANISMILIKKIDDDGE